MSKRRCGLCGRDPAAGFASINGTWFCHGDDDPEPTCYMRAEQTMMVPLTAMPNGEGYDWWADAAKTLRRTDES